MSLLASLIQASTRFQQTTEQRQSNAQTSAKPSEKTAVAATDAASSPTDDRFTPSGDEPGNPRDLKTRNLSLGQYKQTMAQDLSFVRDTLRHKLAEYNLHPATALKVTKGEDGNPKVDGKLTDTVRAGIEKDLQNNKPFREALSRLSVTEPTINFMDNALKLTKAYGAQNTLLDALVSENQQFNGLQDLLHRYDNLRRNAPAETLDLSNRQRYAFNLNTRA
ncbi:MAG: hypothetical protein B7X58_04480 [Marinobacter sp. 34-60-7]|nr:MAG: hypothetical protein B7X58_04480 [Marinobacter sp. 34-60-7]